jgi:hypothetical protein
MNYEKAESGKAGKRKQKNKAFLTAKYAKYANKFNENRDF